MMLLTAVYGPTRAALAGFAAVSTASVYLSYHRVYADSHPHRTEKLSIYSEPTPEIVLVETHTTLEQNIGNVRRIGTMAYLEGKNRAQGVVNEWIGIEHAVERKVKQIVSPDESVTPGILYVGVATLTGSVLGRNRLLLRLSLPPIFFVLSFNHFLPKASSNFWAYLTSIEESYFPFVAQRHTILKRRASTAVAKGRQTFQGSTDWLGGRIKEGIGAVESQIGMKVGDALGFTQSVGTHVVDQAKELGAAVQTRVRDVTETDISAVMPKGEPKETEVKRLV